MHELRILWMNFIHYGWKMDKNGWILYMFDECHVINEKWMVINEFHPLCMKKNDYGWISYMWMNFNKWKLNDDG
jgi:hypothetical protein